MRASSNFIDLQSFEQKVRTTPETVVGLQFYTRGMVAMQDLTLRYSTFEYQDNAYANVAGASKDSYLTIDQKLPSKTVAG